MATHLLEIVTPATAGDPRGARTWRRSRRRQLSQRLAHMGHAASAPTVSWRLNKHADAPRVTAKAQAAGSQPPDRARQWQDIAAHNQAFAAAGWPSLSVDTTQQALLGDGKNAGPGWCQHPIEVNSHDFPGDARGRAVPYGIYDLQRNHGAV